MFIDAQLRRRFDGQGGRLLFCRARSQRVYHETLDGIRAATPKHQFTVAVDPYLRPGDPASGLLPLIQDQPAGQAGEGDHSVQPYNFRLCLTRNPTNKIPIAPPADYDPARYELLARYIEAMVAAGQNRAWISSWTFMPCRTARPMSTITAVSRPIFIGGNAGYVEGSYSERARIPAGA